MRINAVIQARLSSERLPGKALRRMAGRPMLEYVVESLAHARLIDEIVLATSIDTADDALATFAAERGIVCVRGDLDDVAGRLLGTARTLGADAFVRVNGDSPLLDPRLVDRGIDL